MIDYKIFTAKRLSPDTGSFGRTVYSCLQYRFTLCDFSFGHTTLASHSATMAGYTLIAKYTKTIVKNEKCIAGYLKTIAKCEKRKVYSRVFHITFFAFCISQYFVPRSAFAQKLKGFCGLFLCGIDKTRNSHEI